MLHVRVMLRNRFDCNFVLQPERINPDPDSPGYNVKSDVWSLGITLVIIMFLLTLQKVLVGDDDLFAGKYCPSVSKGLYQSTCEIMLKWCRTTVFVSIFLQALVIVMSIM